jgi:hypothetical protein
MGPAATVFYKRLASMISEKKNSKYATIITWIRCKISFALLRMAILAIRGGRSKPGTPSRDPVEVQISEGRI